MPGSEESGRDRLCAKERTRGPRFRSARRLAFGLALALTWACSNGSPQPSVLVITIDTLRADHLGSYGYERARTPNLDALAGRSILFERAHTVSNNTLPAHASILTGRYPHSIGIPRNSFPLGDSEVTLAQLFGTAGYETAAFVSASALASPMGLDRGFDLYDERFGVKEMDQEQRRAETTTDAVLSWLRRRTDETPFFAWVHYFDPHYPYTPPAPYDTIYGSDYDGPADGSMEHLCTIWGLGTEPVPPTPADIQRLIDLYDGEIAYLDAQLGRLFDYLGESGLDEELLIVVTADHGESLDEHEYYFNHGLYLYEPSLFVPLLVRYPAGASIAPRRTEAQAQVLDVFPTVLSAAGLAIPPNVEGFDLNPIARGDAESIRRYSYAESCRPWEVEQQNPEGYRNLHKAQTLVEGNWKLIATPYTGQTELYHLGRDSEELVNLAGTQSQRVAEMWQELREWRKGTLPGGPPDPENLERLRSLGYTR